MQRKLRPEFSATEAPSDVTEISQRERAKRLALFLSTVWEDPEAYKKLIGRFYRVKDVPAKSVIPDVMQYGRTPDDYETFPYETRAMYVTGLILQYEDDLEADTDPETAEAMRAAITQERRKNPDANARIIRLGALAGQISLYETLHTPDVLRDSRSMVVEHNSMIYEEQLRQADIA